MVSNDELTAIATQAAPFAAPGEELAAVLAAEPATGERLYVCAFAGADGARTWLVLDAGGAPVDRRTEVRDAVAIAALCELAGETAAGGDLDELHSQLVALRLTENPPGIDDAEDALLALQRAIGSPPRLATVAYLDGVGMAARRLEEALGGNGASPFAEAMKSATAAVEALTSEVESAYKLSLS